jgi:hypothetical protein
MKPKIPYANIQHKIKVGELYRPTLGVVYVLVICVRTLTVHTYVIL